MVTDYSIGKHRERIFSSSQQVLSDSTQKEFLTAAEILFLSIFPLNFSMRYNTEALDTPSCECTAWWVFFPPMYTYASPLPVPQKDPCTLSQSVPLPLVSEPLFWFHRLSLALDFYQKLYEDFYYKSVSPRRESNTSYRLWRASFGSHAAKLRVSCVFYPRGNWFSLRN